MGGWKIEAFFHFFYFPNIESIETFEINWKISGDILKEASHQNELNLEMGLEAER